MKPIYIVGAQCTGKTTLTEAIATRLKSEHSDTKLEVINEMARRVLGKHSFDRNDVREGSERCLLLQKLILKSQYQREIHAASESILLSDRSGIDPLAYASLYAKDPDAVQNLSESVEWQQLKNRMMCAVVVVWEPVEDWLFDDGIRLMPQNLDEWMQLHDTFRRLLKDHGIAFEVLPATLRSLGGRVEFVMSFSQA